MSSSHAVDAATIAWNPLFDHLGAATDEDVARAEAALGVELPAQFRQLLMLRGGCRPLYSGFIYKDLHTGHYGTSSMGPVYHVKQVPDPQDHAADYSVVHMNQQIWRQDSNSGTLPADAPITMVAFAEDEAGRHVCLDVLTGAVLLVQGGSAESASLVAETLDEFLEALHDAEDQAFDDAAQELVQPDEELLMHLDPAELEAMGVQLADLISFAEEDGIEYELRRAGAVGGVGGGGGGGGGDDDDDDDDDDGTGKNAVRSEVNGLYGVDDDNPLDLVTAEDRLSIYYCDGCGRRLSLDEMRFRCVECPWSVDLCEGCMALRDRLDFDPPHKWSHGMEQVPITEDEIYMNTPSKQTPLSDYFCNGCGSRFRVEHVRWVCTVCHEIDLCKSCLSVPPELIGEDGTHKSDHRLERVEYNGHGNDDDDVDGGAVDVMQPYQHPAGMRRFEFCFVACVEQAGWMQDKVRVLGDHADSAFPKADLGHNLGARLDAFQKADAVTQDRVAWLEVMQRGLYAVNAVPGAAHSIGMGYMFGAPEIVVLGSEEHWTCGMLASVANRICAGLLAPSAAVEDRFHEGGDLSLLMFADRLLDKDEAQEEADAAAVRKMVPRLDLRACVFSAPKPQEVEQHLEELGWFYFTFADTGAFPCLVCRLELKQ